jgi:hypothetical protein
VTTGPREPADGAVSRLRRRGPASSAGPVGTPAPGPRPGGRGSLLRVAAAVAMLAVAVAALLLAADVGSWQTAIQAGDTRFVQAPGAASWTASTTLPFRLGERVLGLSDQLAFRNAAQSFVSVQAAGQGLDNGYSEGQARDALETVLVGLTQGSDRLRDSEAENLLGILAFVDSEHTGPNTPAPVERSVADFQAAVQLDPENEDAKFNLELVLRRLLAQGVRPGSSNAGGAAKGHKGAAGGTPGRGY